jgi:chitodextrinase
LDASWNASERASSYIVEQSLQPPPGAQWTQVAVTTKSSRTIAGLQSGTRYWFRVAAVGPEGQSGFSDPATRIAP